MKRKRRASAPREASTYRGARRNQCFRVDGTVWPGAEARYVPHTLKPPVIKFDWSLVAQGKSPILKFRVRKQPKTYKPNGERECARRMRQMAGAA